MVHVFTLKETNGTLNTMFLLDEEIGQTAKSIMTVPGAYNAFMSKMPGCKLELRNLTGTIGNRTTTICGLTIEGVEELDDATDVLAPLLGVQDTVAKAMINSYPKDFHELINTVLDMFKYYENVESGDKICLPPEVLTKLDPEIAAKISSMRTVCVLSDLENREIFQTAFDAEYGIVLPEVGDIHNGDSKYINALDILRVTMPYRLEPRPQQWDYKSIYHTPYYKTNMQIRGFVPAKLNWIAGNPANDMMETMPNEQHMASNLRKLIQVDISRYVVQMVSGIFLDTPFGAVIGRFCGSNNRDLIPQMCEDMRNLSTAEVQCDIPFVEVNTLEANGWYNTDVVRTVRKYLTISDDYLMKLITERPSDRRFIECDNLPFTFSLSNEQQQAFTDALIAKNYISSAMQKFLIDLCKKAYRVNWGHTGAALAIPGFNYGQDFQKIDEDCKEYLADCKGALPPDPNNGKYTRLYVKTSDDDDDDEFNTDSEDEIFSSIEYYITAATAAKIANNTLPSQYFTEKATAAETTEAAIIEYWHYVNGESNLNSFLLHSFFQTADVNIFIDAFIKLMRWGERKPKLLVFQNYPEIRYVFDLNKGLSVDNTAIVDESELIKHNGCDYYMVGYLKSTSNPSIAENYLLGFILQKEYPNVKKNYLASWLDIAEMIKQNNSGDTPINISDFVSLKKVDLSSSVYIPIENFSQEDYQIFVSDSNIAEGLKHTRQPQEFSPMFLLPTAGITNTVEYLRSLKNKTVLTIKDRQYDILHRYISALTQFYAQYGDQINSAKTSKDIADLSLKFFDLYNGNGAGKEDANTANARSNIQSLSFEGDSVYPWDTSALEGQFAMIHDRAMQAKIPPITFTDPYVANISRRLQNRVVLLLLALSDRYVLCRKDIKAAEVRKLKKPDGSGLVLDSYSYDKFAAAIDQTLKGAKKKVNHLPLVLHESLKDFL